MPARELDAIAPFERYYDAAGIRTRCFEKGEGKPVILLHGGGGHAETWVRNLIPLSQKFRVLAIDYRGYGSSEGSPSERGLTLVPTRMYFKDGKVKVELALARGKERVDKRRAIVDRDAKRQMERAVKSRRR